MEMGAYISLSGIVTFRNAKALQDVARNLPLDRLLVETDAPFLAPVPVRGKVGEPAFVGHTARFLAGLRDMPFEALAEATTANARRLFSRLTN
jgi:TatD DNase family protein